MEKWVWYTFLAGVGCIPAAYLTGFIGGHELIGTTYIPGVGFFIFGGLGLILLLISVVLGLVYVLKLIFKRGE